MGLDPRKAAGSLFDEFKNFAFKGNVIDLAVGIIIGAAFSTIITSLVSHVIMPLVSYITPNMDFKDWHLGKIQIGLFLNSVIAFLITALALFIFIVKFLGWLMKAKKEDAPAVPATPEDVLLLREIRDSLKSR